MHEETNEDEEDKLEEEMSPQLSRIRSGEAGYLEQGEEREDNKYFQIHLAKSNKLPKPNILFLTRGNLHLQQNIQQSRVFRAEYKPESC